MTGSCHDIWRCRVLQSTSWWSTASWHRLFSLAANNRRRVTIHNTKISYTMQQPQGDSTVSMQPEFIEHTQVNPAMEQMFQAMSTMMMQVNHTNQTLMTWLTNQSDGITTKKQKDSRIDQILLGSSNRRCSSMVGSFWQRGELSWMAQRKKGVRIANGTRACCCHMVHSIARGNQTKLDLLTRATQTTLHKQQCHTNSSPTIKQFTSTSTWTCDTNRRQNEIVVAACRPQYGDHEALFSTTTTTPWHIPSC